MIPAPIAERWRPMWHPDAHPARPWWRLEKQDHEPGRGYWTRWARCDGRFCDPHADAATLSGDLARIDHEHPLPPPPPMPGQVWVHVESGEETLIRAVAGEAASRNTSVPGSAWPPPGAILVAGPTPWGRDVPWMVLRA